MKILNKITEFLIAQPEDEIVEETIATKKEQPQANPVLKKEEPTADGTTAYDSTAGTSRSFEKYSTARPTRTVSRGSKTPDMRIVVFNVDAFDEVKMVADALKQKRAVLINYEKVDNDVQKRICDFVNGVCYVLNGEVKRVSNTMVLYVPENISIGNGIIRGADGIFTGHAAS